MSKKIRVAIAEPSEILRAGIIDMLRRINSLDIYIIEITDMNQLECVLCKYTPDLFIINPSATDTRITGKVRTLCGNNKMKSLALLHSLADSHTLEHYDDSISIYDSAEQIRNKIIKLFNVDLQKDISKELSKREKDIIVEVVKGLTNKQIADKLFISVHTVMTHRKNIASKLQIHSPSGLTIYAILNNLVDLDQVNY
ncbi:MAG: LuxR C-terminal-related transcriptional regulator [Bacteroidales bacterium]|jgi:DNA-binding CsgD family transcriptional regulator